MRWSDRLGVAVGLAAAMVGLAGTPAAGYVCSGWTANHLYDGPLTTATGGPAQGLAWPAAQPPVALSAQGYVAGLWFDAVREKSIPHLPGPRRRAFEAQRYHRYVIRPE